MYVVTPRSDYRQNVKRYVDDDDDAAAELLFYPSDEDRDPSDCVSPDFSLSGHPAIEELTNGNRAGYVYHPSSRNASTVTDIDFAHSTVQAAFASPPKGYRSISSTPPPAQCSTSKLLNNFFQDVPAAIDFAHSSSQAASASPPSITITSPGVYAFKNPGGSWNHNCKATFVEEVGDATDDRPLDNRDNSYSDGSTPEGYIPFETPRKVPIRKETVTSPRVGKSAIPSADPRANPSASSSLTPNTNPSARRSAAPSASPSVIDLTITSPLTTARSVTITAAARKIEGYLPAGRFYKIENGRRLNANQLLRIRAEE